MKTELRLIIVSILFMTNCSQLPKERLSQFEVNIFKHSVANDSLFIELNNPLHCPIRIDVKSNKKDIQELVSNEFPLTIAPQKDTSMTFGTNRFKEELELEISAEMGDPISVVNKKPINLPFMKGRRYKIIQGYNGSFSHTTDYSRYALDFNLSVGDTICASADGYVVGVIEDYSKGGRSKKWRNYANFITIYHPEMNLYTQYVHLNHKGSFVEVGDFVTAEQAIGISGETGYRTVVHLHFNVLVPNDIGGMKSEPINFKEGYKGVDLRKGDWVEK